MTSVKILIVDHDSSATQELQMRLLKLGYEVIGTAKSSEEAVYKSAKLQPSLILMNTHLRTGNDGINTGKLIHSFNNIPVIYVSSRASQDTIRKAGSTGPFGYIIKPFDDSQLFVTIEIARIRFKLESQLRESQQWLTGVLLSIGDGVIAVDTKGVIRFVNPKAEEISGWDEAAALDKSLFEVFKPIDERSGELLDLSSCVPQASDGDPTESRMEAMLIVRDGNHIPVEINFNPIIDQNDNICGLVLAFRDITSRRFATAQIKVQTNRAEALGKVAEQLNSHIEFKEVLDTVCTLANQLLNTSASMIFLYDPKSNLYKDMARRVEFSHAKADQNSFRISFDRETLQAFLRVGNSAFSIQNVKSHKAIPIKPILRLLNIQTLAVAPLTRNGDVIGVLVCGSPGRVQNYSQDELVLLNSLANHITIAISNASMFEQVRNGRERQRKLAKGLVELQETERRNIARELHDHFGQALTGLQLMLVAFQNNASATQKNKLEEIQKYVRDIIAQVREMSLNLRPSMLDDFGLLPTLKWHFERFTNQTGINVNFRCDEFRARFPADIELTAFRIIQEALTNVARYAQVENVFVGLALQENTLWVEILDKGKGFDASSLNDKPTAGLGGMRERSNLVGGYLAVNSYLNQGTQILAALPLNNMPIERRKYDRNNPIG